MALGLIVLAGAILLPRWDRREEDAGVYFRSRTGRKVALLGVFLGLDLTPLLVAADEYWIDLPGLLPNWSIFFSHGLIPLFVILASMGMVYLISRWLFKANHSEGLVGLFGFIMTSLLILTIIGQFFRGANMALVLPF